MAICLLIYKAYPIFGIHFGDRRSTVILWEIRSIELYVKLSLSVAVTHLFPAFQLQSRRDVFLETLDDINRRLNVKEACGNCVCTWRMGLQRLRDKSRTISFPATKNDVSGTGSRVESRINYRG